MMGEELGVRKNMYGTSELYVRLTGKRFAGRRRKTRICVCVARVCALVNASRPNFLIETQGRENVRGVRHSEENIRGMRRCEGSVCGTCLCFGKCQQTRNLRGGRGSVGVTATCRSWVLSVKTGKALMFMFILRKLCTLLIRLGKL